jgi:hypothetical protein
MRTLSEIKSEKKSTLNEVLIAIMSFEPWELMHILENDRTYQDVSLLEFVELVQVELDRFKIAGDSVLMLDLNICKGCQCDEPIVVFTGNVSDWQYALYFEYENDQIVDIFQCNLFGDRELF